MFFIPMPKPTKPGCWVLTPTGCPKQKFVSFARTKSDCSWPTCFNWFGSRMRSCGKETSGMMIYRPLPCHVCSILLINRGETHRNAKYDKGACLNTRTRDYNNWCGAVCNVFPNFQIVCCLHAFLFNQKDTVMVWNPTKAPTRPTAPGCVRFVKDFISNFCVGIEWFFFFFVFSVFTTVRIYTI